MRITTGQIRAARALLNWSQTELAQRCNLSLTTVGNIENGTSHARENTLADIQKTLEDGGIEFTEDEGVRRKRADIVRLDGVLGLQHLMDDIYAYAREGGKEVLLFNAYPDNWVKWLGKEWLQMHLKRMQQFQDVLDYKITTKQGIKNLVSDKFATYRSIPDNMFNDRSIYCYGDRIVFVNFESDKVSAFMLKQPYFAMSFRALFNTVWEQLAKGVA